MKLLRALLLVAVPAFATGDDNLKTTTLLAASKDGAKLLLLERSFEEARVVLATVGTSAPTGLLTVMDEERAHSDYQPGPPPHVHPTDLAAEDALARIVRVMPGAAGLQAAPPSTLISPYAARAIAVVYAKNTLTFQLVTADERTAVATAPYVTDCAQVRAAGLGLRASYNSGAFQVYWLGPDQVVVVGDLPRCAMGTMSTDRFFKILTLPPAGELEAGRKWAMRLNEIGVEALKGDQPGEATRWLERAVTVSATYEVALYNAACAWARAGNFSIAFDRLQALQKLGTPLARQKLQKATTDPDFERAWKNVTFTEDARTILNGRPDAGR